MLLGKLVNARTMGSVIIVLLMLSAPLLAARSASAEPVEYVSNLAQLPEERIYAGTVELDGKLYLFGGFRSDVYGMSENAKNTVWIYDIGTGQVDRGADMPVGTVLPVCAAGRDGMMYVFGGYNATIGGYTYQTQIYDPVRDTWSSGAAAPTPIGGGDAVAVANGSIYLFGAAVYSASMTLMYRPATDSWHTAAPQASGSIWQRQAVYWNETSVFVLGGRDSIAYTAVDDASVYNPAMNTWTSVAPMPVASNMGAAGLTANGYIYYAVGTDGQWTDIGTLYSSLKRYDVAHDTWEVSTFSSVWPARSAVSSAVDSYGRLFLVGGWDGSSTLRTVTMIVTADVVFDQLDIVSPSGGSYVNGEVTVTAVLSNAWVGASVAEFMVDGSLVESKMMQWSTSVTFLWDSSAEPDGSTHVLTVRAYLWDGGVREDSVTVIVSALSLDEKVSQLEGAITTLQSQVDSLEAQLTDLESNMGDRFDAVEAEIAALEAMIDALGAEVSTLQTLLSALENTVEDGDEALAAQIEELQDQLAAIDTAIDEMRASLEDAQSSIGDVQGSVEDRMSAALGYAIIGLLVVVIALLCLVLVMGRKPSAPPPPSA